MSTNSATEPDTATKTSCAAAVTPRTTEADLDGPDACGAVAQRVVDAVCVVVTVSGAHYRHPLIVQNAQLAVVQVVRRNATRRVLGVVHCIGDELADVNVHEPVEHLGALATGPHQSRHPQYGEVLRHRRRRLRDP